MNKFIIAIDVDNVLNNLMEKSIEMYNITYNTFLTIDDFIKYDIFQVLDFKEAENFIELFLKQELWDSLTPLKNSQWGVKKLIENGYEVYFATSTHYSNFSWKVEWLKKYFPMIPEKNIICIHNKGLLKCDVMIEDCVDNLLSNTSCYRVLLDYSWNREVHDDARLIYRVHNWEEIIQTIDKLYEFDNEKE